MGAAGRIIRGKWTPAHRVEAALAAITEGRTLATPVEPTKPRRGRPRKPLIGPSSPAEQVAEDTATETP